MTATVVAVDQADESMLVRFPMDGLVPIPVPK